MACHEIAALRLGLMRILGRDDVAERQHELAELGPAAAEPGPVSALCEAGSLGGLQRLFRAALADLDRKVAGTPDGDVKLPYLRTLMVLTKKVELDLVGHLDALTRFYRELDEMHDFVHEIYPAAE
ncbi:MAG TPA: DUF3209 family protein [Polyangia bacterium]|jgi:hypothetical protein|nr:DUF3209 family protein [Polyangia bacterium]